MKGLSAIALTLFPVILLTACSAGQPASSPLESGILSTGGQSSKIVKIVAAENFYGDIARQLAGSHANVVSILSDPNVDPHEYESTVQDGVNVSDANIIIENGLDYDSWMDKLIGAAPNPQRTVITAGKIATDLIPENPHIWYGVDNMPVIAGAIHDALKKADPADGADFDNNLAAFDASIVALQQKMADIKSKFNGTPAALTETIFLYQAKPLGLNILTPLDFQMAISEGNDPSASDVQTTNDQLLNKKVMVLIFNSQTVTPVTTNLQNEAKQLNIPLVTVTETMPLGQNYQGWMTEQLDDLQQSLYNGGAG